MQHSTPKIVLESSVGVDDKIIRFKTGRVGAITEMLKAKWTERPSEF